MKVLIIGSGGREHALVLQVLKSQKVKKVFVAPGNAGMASVAECVSISPDKIEQLLSFAQKERIDLTIVGPELPLTLGIVDAFTAVGLRIFGPSQQASELEGSKAFTKDFCARHHIPTAAFECFTDCAAARAYLQNRHRFPVVIKADGLAAGKGVVIAQNRAEADQAVVEMMTADKFGSAGRKIVVEEFLTGAEASFIVMADGKNFIEFPAAQDHKRIFDNDEGPNTGGMGAYAPAPLVTPRVRHNICERIIKPTLAGLVAEGRPFVGFLFAGLMIDDDGEPFLIEYNCRFGDPEAEAILPLLKTDLVTLMLAALEQKLNTQQVEFENKSCVAVVLCSGGYPDAVRKGFVIQGLATPTDLAVTIFHAGTRQKDSTIINDSGRVLVVSAKGDTLRQAIAKAYAGVTPIYWEGMQYRKDIGAKGLK